ncbi:MAG: sigma-70 family RNA polymerase sigma factor [Actinomycetota bacterium]|nr:sigma-70 family RNA polymerase sigma factor [Actinomycetota bacterium]
MAVEDDSGEPADFETWYRRAHPRLGTALSLAFGDRDLAQDAADEAVARAYERWHDVSTMASPDGWLYRVAFNVARRRLRRRSLEARLLRRGRPEHAAPPAGELWLVVAELPERQRLAVVLRHVGQLTEPEIAEIMGVARGTVSSTLRTAHRSLRDRLADTTVGREAR